MMRKLRFLKGTIEERLASYKNLKSMGYKDGRCTGPYQIDFNASDELRSFYLGSDFQPSNRWWFTDESPESPGHSKNIGNVCDAYSTQFLRGIIVKLPKHRGYLAGWSMGEGMISAVQKKVLATVTDAIRVADNLAVREAEIMLQDDQRYQKEQEEQYKSELFAQPGNGAIYSIFQSL
jgi:hypothetical protein